MKTVSSALLSAALDRMPHRPPMRLISRLVCVHTDNNADGAAPCYEAEAVIDATNPFLYGEVLERVALAEMLAQAFAAGSALHDEGEPRVGYLVGLRGVRFHDDARLGDTLRVRVRLETSLAPFFLICGEVCALRTDASETLLADGQIRLFLPEHSIETANCAGENS